ncbi:nucleotidyltransferase domain-containing protein [Candidatus Methylomirabilis sp.]|uniref:nucleotidyltransferase domain-containing protein n=1 Tax=Candidatus Methylomirabilis sp. TaxID=2032687 RepID=UPI002A636DB4|nr:nucleotidyltransferase domain-containing protein [Candidatus Methylomirabilis sp.]
MKRAHRLSPTERCAIREQIAAELLHYPDVLFAYVYGSFLKSEVFHNVDIGVYLSSSHFNNAMAANLSAHLSGKIKLPVDVRTLNTAPISFRLYVLRGECLFSRNDNLRTSIMEDTMRSYLNIASPRRHTTKEAFGYGESDDSNDGSLRTDDKGHD